MTIHLDVYDVTDTTHLGTLSEAYGKGFQVDLLTGGGACSFSVDVASTADMDLLQPRRVVRFRRDGSPGTGDLEAFVVGDRPATTDGQVERPDGEHITTVTFECPHLLNAWLGTAQGGIVLRPYNGLDGKQQNPRLFGPFAPDFDDSQFAAPTPAGPVSTAGWPDDQTTAFEYSDKAVIRRVTDVDEVEKPARMFLVADWRTEVVVYRNGEEVMRKDAGETGIVESDQLYDGTGEAMVLHAIRRGGGTGRVAWCWMELEVTTDADGNEEFEVGGALRRTFDPADFPGVSDVWVRLNYTVLPGVDVGYVMDVALQEASDRGHSPLPSWTFTGGSGGQDSDGNAWTKEFARGFRLQKLGQLLRELCEVEGEAEMTPDGELKLLLRRGQDRTSTVTVADPFGLGLSGRGPQSTRWLVETDDGMADVIGTNAEAALGVRMEEFVQLGTDITPGATPLSRQLAEDGKVLDEVEVDLPDDVVPYSDVFVGDAVMVGGRDGLQAGRIIDLLLAVDDANGAEDWKAGLVPYTVDAEGSVGSPSGTVSGSGTVA